jgi:SAM-dependent methyltransferase
MRFLRRAFPAARLTACDLDRPGVEFCARHFEAIPVVSHVDVARIPLEGPYDLIWCGSLLTHLPEEKWTAFLALFHRLLLPGGIVVFTTHGRSCETDLVTGKHRYGLEDPQIAALLAAYRRTGFGYVDYADSPGYGISLSLPSYVLAKFVQQPGWQLLGYHEAAWDKRQDVIGLTKV